MRRRLPSPAMVVSVIALCVALSGTGYAAVKLAKNSVGAAQIRTGAVRSSEVKDRSLLAKDFKPGQLPSGARGARGATGPKGVAGLKGATGATGPRGPVGPAGQAGTSPPAAKLLAAQVGTSTGTRNLTDASAQTIDFSGADEIFDTADMFTGPSNKLGAPRAGLYRIIGSGTWAPGTGARRLQLIKVADASVLGEDSREAASTGTTAQSVEALVKLAAGDGVQLRAEQDSGGTLTLTAPKLAMTFVGDVG